MNADTLTLHVIMKRLLLSLALCLCSLTATFAQFSGSGSGTENDPYLIFYADQLTQVRNFLGKSGVYFKLMADIDLTDWIEENSPIRVGNQSVYPLPSFKASSMATTIRSAILTSTDPQQTVSDCLDTRIEQRSRTSSLTKQR